MTKSLSRELTSLKSNNLFYLLLKLRLSFLIKSFPATSEIVQLTSEIDWAQVEENLDGEMAEIISYMKKSKILPEVTSPVKEILLVDYLFSNRLDLNYYVSISDNLKLVFYRSYVRKKEGWYTWSNMHHFEEIIDLVANSDE